MKVFKEGNWRNEEICPICGKQTPGEVVLIGMEGTEKGGTIRAKQVHLDCLDLTIIKLMGKKIIFQLLPFSE